MLLLVYFNSSMLIDAGLLSSTSNTQPFWVGWPLALVQIWIILVTILRYEPKKPIIRLIE
jgi:hypothetical protein